MSVAKSNSQRKSKNWSGPAAASAVGIAILTAFYSKSVTSRVKKKTDEIDGNVKTLTRKIVSLSDEQKKLKRVVQDSELRDRVDRMEESIDEIKVTLEAIAAKVDVPSSVTAKKPRVLRKKPQRQSLELSADEGEEEEERIELPSVVKQRPTKVRARRTSSSSDEESNVERVKDLM